MSIPNKNFAGIDGFTWFFGVVESRQDPLGLGRVKVRAYGWHTEALTDIPTDDLPWAHVIQSPMDRSFATPREADMVFGFFTDGDNAQMPVIVGIVPGYFSEKADGGSGFHDLRSPDQLKVSPRKLVSRTYNTDGSGIKLTEVDLSNATAVDAIHHPTPDELGESSITGVASYQNLANTVIGARKKNLDKDVTTAGNVTWSEPYPAYNPRYPYNQANETESGHVFELDDSPGSERVHLAHRSGSYVEWFPSGTKAEKITKSNYQIIMGDDHLHVMGKVMITVDGDAMIRVVGDTTLQAENNLTANVSGAMKVSVGGALDFKAASVNFDVAGEFAAVSATQKLTSSGGMDIKGSAVRVGGSSVDVSGSTKIANLGPFNSSTGYASQVNVTADSPDAGSAAGLSAPPSAGTPTKGSPTPEPVPVPPDNIIIEFDPETAEAYKHDQFLDTNADGTKSDPGKNSTTLAQEIAVAGPCNFDVHSKTFIADSATWTMSSAGFAFLRSQEGFANTKIVGPDRCMAYFDPPNSRSTYAIGYGTTAVAIDRPITAGMVISRQEAEDFLQYFINKKCLPALRQSVTVPLTQNMIDACLDLMYNIGIPHFKTSTLVEKINAQAWCDAGYQFLVWSKSGSQRLPALVRRRSLERKTFLT